MSKIPGGMSRPEGVRAVTVPPPGRTSADHPPGPAGYGSRATAPQPNGRSPGRPDGATGPDSQPDRGLLLANEIALTIVSLAAVVGMHRLFVDGSYRGALALQVVVAHAVVASLRRARVSLLPAALVTIVAGALFITWTRFPGTAQWLLPTGETARQLGDDLSAAWHIFGDVSAPAPVANGFVVVSAAAIWLLAFIADWAAFRVSATLEALLPATTLFVVAAMLGDEGSPVASAAVFSAAALVWVLVHRTTNQERRSRWAGGRRAHGRWSVVGTGSLIIGAAVILGTVAGPQLPGADADALLAWRDINKDDPSRVVLSPMVSLQTNLVDQPDVEVFTVRSERSSYWRLTSLDEFDGELWRSSYSTDDASGPLPRALETAGEGETITQEITINGLSSVWLPAAFEPVAVDTGEDQPTDVDARSSTLMVDSDVDYSDGYTYDVTSRIPDWTAAELRRATSEVPDEIAERYLPLPEGFPDAARAEAVRLTQTEDTSYDKALALQRYFRSGEFTYDINVGPGHSEQALLDFLFETRRGYCEQFAAAYAALARAANLPSRVAVGFTPGVQDENDPTLFRVRGIHAHAWVEIYLGEYGWVTFDPTPTRGPPGAGNWLGITESQDTTGGGAAITDPGSASGFGESGAVPQGGSGDENRGPGLGLEDGAVTGGGAGSDDPEPFLPEPVRDAALPVGLAVLAYAVLVPLAIVIQRFVRRRRAKSAAAKVRLWWQRLTTELAADGVALPPWLTIAEKADRMAEALPDATPEIQGLARKMEVIVYGEAAPPAEEITEAEGAWAAVVAKAARRRSWRGRALRYLDVRQLFTRRPDRLVAHGGAAPAAVVSSP
jgi:TgpA N-terminal domain/Transglutaminase-like superfamily